MKELYKNSRSIIYQMENGNIRKYAGNSVGADLIKNEIFCLQFLNENCIGSTWFPRIINYDAEKYSWFEMEYLGNSLFKNYHTVDDYIPQIDMMFDDMDFYQIAHGDIHARNICILENKLHLIDFGYSTINGEPFLKDSGQLRHRPGKSSKDLMIKTVRKWLLPKNKRKNK